MAITLNSLDKKAFIFSFVYVGISTVFLFTVYPSDPFSFDGLYDSIIYLILSFLCLPGQLFSIGIRFADSDLIFVVLLSQLVNLVIWYYLLKFILKKLLN